MNKQELIAKVAEKSGLTKAQAQDAMEAAIEAIGEALSKGDEVRLIGFGTFLVTHRPERDVRIPGTKDTKRVPAVNVPKFKPGKGLKDTVNK